MVDDGFRYVVVHHPGSTIPDHIAGYFPPESFYQDGELTAYGLAELRDDSPCEYFYDREFTPLSPDISTSIVWDESISLLGYDDPIIDSDSQTLSINVYWQAHSLIDNSYTVYLHLVESETGMLFAQADVIPQEWSYPTDWWAVDEVVEDTIQLDLNNVQPGNYELRIGWYDQETGERLTPVSEQIDLHPDGSASLIELEY